MLLHILWFYFVFFHGGFRSIVVTLDWTKEMFYNVNDDVARRSSIAIGKENVIYTNARWEIQENDALPVASVCLPFVYTLYMFRFQFFFSSFFFIQQRKDKSLAKE